MPYLLTLKGPHPGRQYEIEPGANVLGRQADATICLESQAVSRHHARIERQDGQCFIEDLQSSNGTFVNGQRIRGRVPLNDGDGVQLGPYHFVVRSGVTPAGGDDGLVIREQVNADTSHHTLYTQDASHKLRAVLEIAQHLARTLDTDTLLGRLLDHLLGLFPQADRGMALLCEGDRLVVRAQRLRRTGSGDSYTYSRTVVQKALADGVGILSRDARADERFVGSTTLSSLNMRSLLCVPLLGQGSRRLGVLQLDSLQAGRPFQSDDLHLLTTIGLQVATVLENANLHAELLREERLRQEVELARQIQQGFLPAEFPPPAEHGFELYARVCPAREVSGDFYNFFFLGDGRLAFFVGDVAGKGIPAALFMAAVRSLGRHIALAGGSPAATLTGLNAALAADNPACMFATLVHGVYCPATGAGTLAVAGHPPPLVRRRDGAVEPVCPPGGTMVGYEGAAGWTDVPFRLEPGDLLALYTDGLTEARGTEPEQMFGVERVRTMLAAWGPDRPLVDCVDAALAAVQQYTGSPEVQDDLTLFLLRRAATA